eukprot:2968530-Rhodomonas_salina.1
MARYENRDSYAADLPRVMSASSSLLKHLEKASLDSGKAAVAVILFISELVQSMLAMYRQDAILSLIHI